MSGRQAIKEIIDMNKTEWPPIAFGTVFWKEVGEKADWITRIESFLQQNIQLDDYGSGISAIRFVSVAVMPSNKRHEEYIKYFRKYKELVVNLKLNYDAVAQAKEPTFLQLVAHLFLRAIDEAPQQKIKDFDWPRFRRDVTELFEEEG